MRPKVLSLYLKTHVSVTLMERPLADQNLLWRVRALALVVSCTRGPSAKSDSAYFGWTRNQILRCSNGYGQDSLVTTQKEKPPETQSQPSCTWWAFNTWYLEPVRFYTALHLMNSFHKCHPGIDATYNSRLQDQKILSPPATQNRRSPSLVWTWRSYSAIPDWDLRLSFFLSFPFHFFLLHLLLPPPSSSSPTSSSLKIILDTEPRWRRR